ncbi:VWA domain-containing protein [Halobaculum sp. MBLA0147]|uniref:VWA domain-containing protein n=1 Tax=Halobaculum sp. MBLA0147 TaxID=3079934 RepID=UPI0035235E59
MHLTDDTTHAELTALSTPSRGSEERRTELERLASLCTDRDTSVSVVFDDDTALARPADGTDGYEIVVPTQKYEQPGSAVPPALWDRAIQVAFLFHELGHVHYSAFEQFGERLETVDPRWREVFRTVYNAAEDVAVETQIADEFEVAADFRLLSTVLSTRADRRHTEYVDLFDLTTADGRPRRSYTVFEAVTVGLFDRGFVDSGRFAELLDPAVDTRVVHGDRRDVVASLAPAIDDFVVDMLSEPDGTRRVERAHEFFRRVRDSLVSLPPRQSGRVQTAPVRPPDARAVSDWRAAPATGLPDEESARRHVEGDSDGGGRWKHTGDADGAGGGAERPPGPLDDEIVQRATRRRTGSRTGHADTGTDPLEREARRLLTVIDDDTTDLDDVIVVDPDEDGGDAGRWRRAVGRARRLERELATRLRRERRPRDTSGHRTGRLDGRRLVAASRGNQRVFTRRESGTLTDYSCLLVLDRSGSMDGAKVETAETATAQLVSALYGAGVDTSVLSVWRGFPCLELPFGGRPADHVDRLVTGRTGGGTPLSAAVSVCRHRVDRGSGTTPFVVVITDGEPDDPDAYRTALEKCTFPVFGVYVGATPGRHTEYFDRIVYTETDALEHTLRQLVRRAFGSGV